jgi:hypothetical protein
VRGRKEESGFVCLNSHSPHKYVRGSLSSQLFADAFDRDDADIVIKVRSVSKRGHIFQDGGA